MTTNSFGARSRLAVGDTTYDVYRLDRIDGWQRLPSSLKVLLENLLRREDGTLVTAEQISALAAWDPAELVIDHSIIADVFARPDAFRVNADLEFARNQERYQLLRWAQQAFDNLRVVPPNTGICHQVNLEYLARVVFTRNGPEGVMAYPDTLVGTDSHTPMINGLGVLGWGVGGIEAEAAMLGQPVSMLIPQVIGFKLTGELSEGTTATDLVLTVAELLRRTGVAGKFVDFYGPGVANVPLANRATIGNMSPEYGSTCAIFPIDGETLDYLRLTGRSERQIRLVEAYAKEQGLWHDPDHEPVYSHTIELDLATVERSIAGPKRPQDRIPLATARHTVGSLLAGQTPTVVSPPAGLDAALRWTFPASDPTAVSRGRAGDGPATASECGQQHQWPSDPVTVTFDDGTTAPVDHGHVVIAAITSCTNTSNPSVMVGAGLLAKKAVQRGLTSKPWVKTSLAPGSRVVTEPLVIAYALVGSMHADLLREPLGQDPDGRATEHPRRRDRLRRRRRAVDHSRRRRVRLGVVAGLGGQGHRTAGGQGRAGRLLRANPPLQPDRHGRAAAAVSARRVGADPGPQRRGALLDHRPGEHRGAATPGHVHVEPDGHRREFTATVRIDTPAEAEYFRHGGILPYVLRQLVAS